MRRVPFLVLLPLLVIHHVGTAAQPDGNAVPDLTVELLGLDNPVLSSVTPSISIRSRYTSADLPPIVLGLRASTSSLVLDKIVLDTFVLAVDSAEIRLSRPLPSGQTLYFRTYARTGLGNVVMSFATPPRTVPKWVTLISPNAPAGAILDDRRPTFVWSGARISVPPGPWTFDVSVAHSAGGPPVFAATTTDTTLTIPFPLEFNTSYRWSVTARLPQESSDGVTSTSTFVIVDESVPRVTLLYQTFPNPFPSEVVQNACIWFDLAERSQVSLDVLDIRTNRVRHLYPQSGVPAIPLEPGRYGRAAISESGCTGDFEWDGRDDNGRRVIPGVYLLRLRAGGREFVKRMVFRG